MPPERVMEIFGDYVEAARVDRGLLYYMLDRDHVLAFASRIREEAIRECDAAVRNIEPGTLNISKPQASSTILSLIEKKP